MVGSSLLLLLPDDPKLQWPKDAMDESLNLMSGLMESHNFAPDMEVWRYAPSGEATYLFRDENKFCQNHYQIKGWLVSEEEVSAIFRCDLGDRFAEYSATIFRYPDLSSTLGPFSRYWWWSQYIILPVSEDRGLGKNFPIIEPNSYSYDGFFQETNGTKIVGTEFILP